MAEYGITAERGGFGVAAAKQQQERAVAGRLEPGMVERVGVVEALRMVCRTEAKPEGFGG